MSTINWFAFAIQIALMVLFPFALAFSFHRRFSVPWKVFFIAAGFYLLNLVIQIPFLLVWFTLFRTSPLILTFFLALTYAVCEETLRYLSFRAGRTMKANRTLAGALMAGIGHGGTESIYFALNGPGYATILLVLIALLAPQFLLKGTHPADILAMPWWIFVITGVERLFGITVHLGLATLIVLAYRRSWFFYPLAIVVHFIIDFTTFTIVSANFLTGNILFFLWAVVSLLFIIFIRRTEPFKTGTVERVDEAPTIAR